MKLGLGGDLRGINESCKTRFKPSLIQRRLQNKTTAHLRALGLEGRVEGVSGKEGGKHRGGGDGKGQGTSGEVGVHGLK